MPVGVIFGVPVGVIVPPVGETDGVAPGEPVLVGDGMAVLVGVGDTIIAVKNAGDVRVHGGTLGMVNFIWISTT